MAASRNESEDMRTDMRKMRKDHVDDAKQRFEEQTEARRKEVAFEKETLQAGEERKARNLRRLEEQVGEGIKEAEKAADVCN